MKLSNKAYDVLKWIALVGCYALNYLWVQLAEVWGFPYATEIGKTISIVGATLGILLGISSIKYHKEQADKEIDIEDDKEESGK